MTPKMSRHYRIAGIFDGINVRGLGMNREFNIACMHVAKRPNSTKIKSAKTFLRYFRENLYPRKIPAIRYIYEF